MASKSVFPVFVLPVILSIIIGAIVLSGILQNFDRELNMWPMSSSDRSSSNHHLQIIGLSKQYSASEPVDIQVKVNDSSFRCGDLYVTIYSSGKSSSITQGGFFDQCFEEDNLLPINNSFSKVVDTPGSYEIVVEMISKDLRNISTKGTFTVK